MTSVSPIAQYLRVNKAVAKHDKNGCHFISKDGLYLGRMTRSVVNNYRVITLETFGENFKKMYTKSIAIGQNFAYFKNISAPLGVSIIPVKTFMRRIFVDFINQTSNVEDTERTIANNFKLIATDEQTGVGLYDTEEPFMYRDKITHSKLNKLNMKKFVYYPS